MMVSGMGSSIALTGAVNATVFEAYLQKVLLPGLPPGQVVVMDHLPTHKGERVRELVEGISCELLYLPAYPPDLNPIEQAFSKVKGLLRKAQARTRQAVVETMGAALDVVTTHKARGFFKHAGHKMLGQSLWFMLQ